MIEKFIVGVVEVIKYQVFTLKANMKMMASITYIICDKPPQWQL